VAPPFSSSRQVSAFAFLLLVLLLLPGAAAQWHWLDRRSIYPAIPVKYGPFTWIQQNVFEQKADADIVFLGSSHIWNGVDTPYVQKKLSDQLGRPAVVFTLGWPWPGFDAMYVIARDLLEHRRVRTLVVYDDGGFDVPHLHSARWFVIGENSEALQGLSLLSKVRLYSGAVLGMPRHLLSRIRPDLTENPLDDRTSFWITYYHAPNLAGQLGALKAHLAFGVSSDFVPFHPSTGASPSDALIYSDQTSKKFVFSSRKPSSYQLHFIKKLAQLCHERGTTLIVLKMPTIDESGDSVTVSAPELSPSAINEAMYFVGIPPAKLFAGLSSGDVQKLFFDSSHLNQNGEEIFTPLVTPALLRLYNAPRRNEE